MPGRAVGQKGKYFMSVNDKLPAAQTQSAGTRRAGQFAAISFAGLLFASLGACTTVEGTNAFTDVGTFEREVMTQTLQGVGLVPQENKPELESPRAPLVLPSDTQTLPPPSESRVAELPTDSDTVQIDTSSISDADLQRLRNARVVDIRSVSGRPLTEAETRQLQARMQGGGISTIQGGRPLYLPPDEYFTTVNNQDLICLAANGDLVPLDDPACPPEIRAALQGTQ